MIKIALVEIGNSHIELLYSQVKFLKSNNYHITAVLNRKFTYLVDELSDVDEFIFVDIEKKGFSKLLQLHKISNILKKGNFQKIIFNTATGNNIKNLVLMNLSNKSEFIGILHHINKLENSFTQKIINLKFKKYFVLNKYLLDTIKSTPQGLEIEVFYPIFFKEYPKIELHKNENEIWITIPGQFELARRDYKFLFESIEKYGINPNIKIILLGKCSIESDYNYLIQQIERLKIKENIIFWKDYVNLSTFYTYMKKSDYLLALIHKDYRNFKLYQNQISGSFNLAIGYKIPQILEDSFIDYEDFKDNSLFYKKEEMMNLINNLTPNNKVYYKDEKWDFEYQKKKFLGLLNS